MQMKDLSPIPNRFTSLIASSEFELSYNGGREKLTVEIGLPVNDVETVSGYDWRCPVRILFEDSIINEQACGCDSFQALNIAMGELVKSKLESIVKEKGAVLLLHGEEHQLTY